MKNIKSTAIMIATAILLVACGGGGGGGSTGGGGNAIVDRDLTLNRPNPEPVFAGYSAPSIFTVSVTNSRTTDNTTVAAVSTGSCTATASAVNNGNATITVTPTATSGLCEVAVTATEDDRESNEESFTFTLSEIAPLISVAGQNSPYAPTAVLADGTITINLTATKQDISNSDVEFAVASNPGGCIIAGLSGTTSYTGAPFFVPLPNTATATQDITISLPGGQGGTCEIEFTATENGQVSAPFIVDANFYPPRIVVAAGAARINLPAIPGTTHEVTIIATKQDMSDIAEVTFTAAFVGNSQYCDVAVANPRASYVGGGAGGIGSMATTNITVSYSGPLSSITQCQVNVAVTEGTKTSNLPFINGLNSAMYVQFVSVNQPPLLGLSDVPTGTPFPDERPRIGVRATKQDTVPSGVVNSEVMVINGACMATLDGEDLSYDIRVSRFGSSSSDAYYNISLDAANAISAVAADRQCEIEFSVTETETIPRRVDGFSYPAGIKNTANRTITFNFAQEMPPLFVNISTPGGNSVTYPSHRKAMVHITLQKQDASSTEIITLPPSINSTGDVCTATLVTPARYADTSMGSVATATYAVNINNFAISSNTACGEFLFTATEGSATASSTAPAIIFTPSAEQPPVVVFNATASTIDTINAIDATIAVTITKQDDEDANLAVAGVISAGPCSIREITNTGYGPNPVLGSVASAIYKVAFTGTTNIDAACTVSITATEDVASTTITQEVLFNTIPTQVSFSDFNSWSGLVGDASRTLLLGVVKEDTTDNLNVVTKVTNIVASNSSGIISSERCSISPKIISKSYSRGSNAIGESRSLNIVFDFVEEYRTAELICAFTFSADVDGNATDSLPPNVKVYTYDFGPSRANSSPISISTPPTLDKEPLFVSVTSDSPVTAIATEDVIISISVQKQDNSNTRNVTLLPSINSTGDVCTANLTNPARYAAPTAGSVATTTYRVEINDRLITTPTPCGSFTFTATEDGEVATAGLTEIITFIPVFPPVITARAVGDATRVYFRDSLEVEITATKQDNSNTLDVTFPTAIDSLGSVCTATLTASTQYAATTMGSVATANYDVTINDKSITTATSCGSFAFTATEDGAVADTDIAITFTPDLPPLIAARVIGTAVDLPADATAMIEVTATKQDNSPTLDVTFPTEIVSSGACRSALVGSTDRQYNGVIGGSSSVTVSYSVAAGLRGNCGVFPLTSQEDATTGINNFASGISFAGIDIGDTDGDNIEDSFDVDADDDGLIEIVSAYELNLLRNNLAGTGLVMAPGAEVNSSGCPSVGGCKGYELVADIDLAAAGYSNWEPIGRGPAFTAIFEGNGFKISNLKIQLDTQVNGWGLFGSIDSATIRNVHLRDVNITMTIDHTLDDNPEIVGGLVGLMTGNSLIINSSAAGLLVTGAAVVGGMVGEALDSQIVSSYAEFGEVNATHGDVGGLVGSSSDIDIKLSYAVTGKVAGQTADNSRGRLGGLVGIISRGSLSSSLAVTANFTEDRLFNSGGLVGLSRASNNIFLAAIANNMNDNSGFIGSFVRSTGQIRSSYAVTNNASKGGFIASILTGATVSSSYWDNTTLTPPDTTTLSANAVGKPTTDLQGTIDFTGIYEEWANGWCDAATNEFTTDPSSPLAIDANRFWDLGGADEYPAMNCLPNFTPAEQRAAMAKALNGESPIRNLR